MSSIRKNLNVTELDFDQIKANLISYFGQADSPLSDWNFAGSGLNVITDALAYNTHYNAILAHMAVSESFIDSAQLRSSVVSLAKLIGYTPRSYSAASATIDISFDAIVLDPPAYISLPKGTQFSSVLYDRTYIFSTVDEVLIPLNAGKYTATNIPIKQGFYQNIRFQVDYSGTSKIISRIIEDQNIDIDSLIVKVYPSASSLVAPEIFSRIEDNISGVTEETPIYFLSENSDESYRVSFGDGVFGKKLQNLSVVELSYMITSGSVANGCTIFSYNDSPPIGATGVSTLTTVQKSSGGSEKENIESIRYNAPLSFVTQNRAVTADDYKNLVKQKFGYVESISVWGGEDHIPVSYGKVFLSMKPYGDELLSEGARAEILAYLKQKNVLTVVPVIVDPEFIDLTLDVFFKYNKNLISLTRGQIESQIRTLIDTYSADVLESFDGIFRYSNLSNRIDSYHPAILNSHIRVFVSRKVTFDPNAVENKVVRFGTALTTDDDKVIISSTPFNVDGVAHYFGDEAISTDTTKRRIYTYYNSNSTRIKVLSDVGILDLVTGEMQLKGITLDETTIVKFDMMPLSNDIAPKRNQILKIDMAYLNVTGENDSIAVGGSSRSVNYTTFQRDR